MIDRALVTRKMVLVTEDLSRLEALAARSLEENLASENDEHVAERCLERMSGRMIDVSYHVLVEPGEPPPRDAFDCFVALSRIGALVHLTPPYQEHLPASPEMDPTVAIPTAITTWANVLTIYGQSSDVTINLSGPHAIADTSMRWRTAADGDSWPLRDTWSPNCVQGPGRVSDPQYFCGNPANLHRSSQVVSSAFALLADGASYNGRQARGIGLSEAFHVDCRAMDVHQSPVTSFTEHADALEQACSDLAGERVVDVRTYQSTAPITAMDCQQVAQATAAVELRATPCQGRQGRSRSKRSGTGSPPSRGARLEPPRLAWRVPEPSAASTPPAAPGGRRADRTPRAARSGRAATASSRPRAT